MAADLRPRIGRAAAAGVALIIGLSAQAAAATVRVAVLEHRTGVVFTCDGGLVVRAAGDVPLTPLVGPRMTTVAEVSVQADGLSLDASVPAGDRVVIAPLGAGILNIDDRPYHGWAIAQRDTTGTFSVVNAVDIEQYLYGVLAAEMDAGWPAAALQSQAVVARTYSLVHAGRHEAEGFDLYAGERDQAYRGAVGESQTIVDAVDSTRGLVLTFENRPIHAYYSSSDGGYTADGTALNDPQPYLAAQPDPYTATLPDVRWSAKLSLDAIGDAVRKKGLGELGSIRGVSLGSPDQSGRIATLSIQGTSGTAEVSAQLFRKLMGTRKIKSTRIDGAVVDGPAVTFTGTGFGHGVGLSQWGARQMAQTGYNATDILRFYYPGTALSSMSSLPPPTAVATPPAKR